MKLSVEFSVDNAAFRNEDADSGLAPLEIAASVDHVAMQIRNGGVGAKVVDFNGNVVGEWAFVQDASDIKDDDSLLVVITRAELASLTADAEAWRENVREGEAEQARDHYDVMTVARPECGHCLNGYESGNVPPHWIIGDDIFCPCTDCLAPIGYSETTDQWFHVLATTPDCFIARQAPVDTKLVP
jgi:hypothetical protein